MRSSTFTPPGASGMASGAEPDLSAEGSVRLDAQVCSWSRRG